MHPSLHVLLVEPDQRRAQTLAGALISLGVLTAHVTNTTQASALLTQIRPDGLVIGVYPTTTHALRSWLAGHLAVAPLWTLLYAEHGALLDAVSMGLPSPIRTTLWPCSHSELTLLLSPLLHLEHR